MHFTAEGTEFVREPSAGSSQVDPAAVTMAPRARREQPAIAILQRYEALGDAISHVPAYFALRHAYPQHRIVSLVARETAFNSSLSRVRSMFFDDIRCGVPLDDGWRELAQHLDVLRPELVLDFRANRRVVWGLLAAHGRARAFIANVAGYALRFGIAGFAEIRPAQNVLRYHRMVEIAAGRRLPFEYRLPELRTAREQAAALLPPGVRYFGLAMSAPGKGKQWPHERFIAIAQHIAQLGLRPVFLLGPLETSLRETVRSAVPQATLIDMIAAGEDASYLPWLFLSAADRLSGLVATEGGIGHLLATREVPLLTLAGPTNVARWKPVTPFWWTIRAQDFGAAQMDAIPVDAVRRVVSEMVQWADDRARRATLPDSASSVPAPAPAAPIRAMS